MFRDMLSTTSGIQYTPSGESQIPLSGVNPSHDYRTRTSYTPQPCNGRGASVKRALTKPFANTGATTNLLSHTLQGTLGRIIRMEARLSRSYGDFGEEINQWNKVLCQSQNSDMVTKMVALMQTNEEIHTLLAEEIEKLKNSFGNIYEREKKLMDKIAQSKKNLAHFEDLTKRIGRNAAKTNLAYESLEEDAENIRVLENQLAVSLSTDLKDAILSYLLRLLVTSSQLHSMVNEYQSSLLEGYSSNMTISSRLAQENASAGNHPQSIIQESPAGKFKSDTEGFKTPTEYSEREELIRRSKQLDTVLLPTPTSGFSGDNGVVLRNAEVPSTNKGTTRGQRILSTFALYQPRETWG